MKPCIDMNRRSLLGGLGALIAAPAIVRASSLMPVKNMLKDDPFWCFDQGLCDGVMTVEGKNQWGWPTKEHVRLFKNKYNDIFHTEHTLWLNRNESFGVIIRPEEVVPAYRTVTTISMADDAKERTYLQMLNPTPDILTEMNDYPSPGYVNHSIPPLADRIHGWKL